MTRRLVLTLSVIALGGCQLYWLKPGADMTAFTAEHQACVKLAGTPIVDDRVLVNLDMYRACLKSRGWARETGSKWGNPPGYYRGLEKEGPVALTDVPQQIPTMEPTRR
jgi:hypothetical protein